MSEDQQELARDLFSSLGIEFNFPNLKGISQSEITYPQFLAIVTQRVMLKQYSAQSVDSKNLLCPIIRVKSVFDENKTKFSDSLKSIELEKKYISLINSQTSKNKITEEFQSSVAGEFVEWYEKNWFNRLKSEEFLNLLVNSFADAKLDKIKEGDDWEKLYQMYSQIDTSKWLEGLEFDTRIFINSAKNADPKWFDDSLRMILHFIEFTGNVELSEFNRLILNEDLIAPTLSSFMISTLMGIEELEEDKTSYNSPFDTYNLFSKFKGTAPGQLMKVNQYLFTIYKYFKIIL